LEFAGVKVLRAFWKGDPEGFVVYQVKLERRINIVAGEDDIVVRSPRASNEGSVRRSQV
jgi:hypothetical protein